MASKTKNGSEKASGKNKKLKILSIVFIIALIWFAFGKFYNYISGIETGIHIELDMFSERVMLLGVSVPQTTLVSYIITAIVLVLSLVFRFVVFPKFNEEKPGKIQNVFELAVEELNKFTKGVVGNLSDNLNAYMFSVAVYLIFCEFAELLGARTPSSDLVVTFSLALITFVLINYYGFRKKGFFGRFKEVFPFKILSDISTPVSLACRLFGNMLGGIIVLELIRSALGGFSAGISSVVGLYFNLFHPLIQIYIFVVLSLTFIKEAIE